MGRRLNQKNLQALESAIYFLKVTELKQLCESHALCAKGSKQDLINTLLCFAKGEGAATLNAIQSSAEKSLRANADNFDESIYMVPGKYRNNRASRTILTELIGRHFTFTAYGMDWVKAEWHAGRCPSYLEFADYWQTEYERRKARGDFASKQTLQRVNFFRTMKEKNLSREALEAAWAKKRAEQAAIALSLFEKLQSAHSA